MPSQRTVRLQLADEHPREHGSCLMYRAAQCSRNIIRSSSDLWVDVIDALPSDYLPGRVMMEYFDDVYIRIDNPYLTFSVRIHDDRIPEGHFISTFSRKMYSDDISFPNQYERRLIRNTRERSIGFK